MCVYVCTQATRRQCNTVRNHHSLVSLFLLLLLLYYHQSSSSSVVCKCVCMCAHRQPNASGTPCEIITRWSLSFFFFFLSIIVTYHHHPLCANVCVCVHTGNQTTVQHRAKSSLVGLSLSSSSSSLLSSIIIIIRCVQMCVYVCTQATERQWNTVRNHHSLVSLFLLLLLVYYRDLSSSSVVCKCVCMCAHRQPDDSATPCEIITRWSLSFFFFFFSIIINHHHHPLCANVCVCVHTGNRTPVEHRAKSSLVGLSLSSSSSCLLS